MRTFLGTLARTSFLFLFLTAAGTGFGLAIGAEPENVGKVEKPPAVAALPSPAAVKPAAEEKTFTFEMRDKPWASVFEWLRDHSDLPVVYNDKPQGTFNFIPRANKKYTIAEIMDILNEGLLSQNRILIRRDQSFLLAVANEKVDPQLIPRISVEDLAKRGNTELVSVVVPLKSLVAENLLPAVKEMIGPHGKVVAVDAINQLIIQDSAGNLKTILKTIHSYENNDKGQMESYSHTCQFIKARDAEKILKDLLGDPRDQQRLNAPPGFPGGGRGNPPGMVIQPGMQGQPGMPGQPGAAAATPKLRMHYIAADERTNTVLVTGPADKIAQAKVILKQIDAQSPGQKPILVGSPELRPYTVPTGTANDLVKTLGGIFKESNTLRITTSGSNKILVYATPEDQFEINKQILTSTEKSIKSELIPLTTQDAEKVAKILKDMFGDNKPGNSFIDVDPSGRNAIIVRGSPEQVADIKAVLVAIGESGDLSGNMRMISIDKGSAATLAEALERLIPQMRDNPVKVIIPGREPREAPPPAKKVKPLRDGSEEQEEPKQAPKQLVDPREKKNAPDDKKGAPITITAVGNRLIVTSDDPKALALVQDLTRVLTQTPSDGGQFEIIRLRNANATEVAKVLDEMFNGPKQTNQFNPYFGGFVGGRSREPATDKHVRIVADPSSNSLLVKASPLELATIRNLLDKALDVAGTPDGQFEVIQLKHANALEVAKVLDEVFTGNKSSKGPDAMQMMFGFRMPQTSTTSQVRIVADPATNSLLVKASPQEMVTIKTLLDKYLDTDKVDSNAVAKTYLIGPLKYANATEVATVIKDVYREHINNNPVGGVITGGTGGSPFSPFGGRRSRSVQNQNIDANGNPRSVDLSIGVDDRSNSLIVMCSKPMYADVKIIAEKLDEAAQNSTRTIKVVSLKGVDPVLVQQAIEAIQGRRNGGQNTSSPGFVPFGTGGMVPGSFRSRTGGGTGTSGGGGGSSSSGGGRSSNNRHDRGPDFFADRVKDDPQPTILFDPQQAVAADHHVNSSGLSRGQDAPTAGTLQLARHEEEQQQPPSPPPGEGTIRGPRSQVSAEALEQLGVIVVTGNNAADVEEILRTIEIIRRLAKGAEYKFELIPLQYGDATSVANTLAQLFQRVQVLPTGNVPSRTTGTGTGATTPGQFGGTTPSATAQGLTSVVLLPIPRQNAILVAAPEIRLKDMEAEIKRLDKPNAPVSRAVPFQLKKASAARVEQLLNTFYASRFSVEGQAQNQIRFTHEDSTNTVFVQAAPADLAEITELIHRIDSTVSEAVNELRIVPLKNVLSDEMAAIIQQAINQSIAAPTAPGAGPIAPTTTPGGGPTGFPGRTTTPGGFPGTPGGFPTTPTPSSTTPGGTGALGGTTTKTTTLRFVFPTRNGARVVESGLLDDIHVTSFPRLNSLLIAAPAKSMDLLMTLIGELDVVPTLQSQIKVFTLKTADATQMAILLQQLFLGTSGGTTGQTPGGNFPGGGPGGGPGGVPTPTGQTFPGASSTGARALTPLTIGGGPPEGAPITDLRITVDPRTNSIIIAGSRNDVDLIETIIFKLEDTEVQNRRNIVYHVRNSTAADLATALNNFLTGSLQVLQRGQQLTPYQDLQREVVVVPEPITNKLIISATPNQYDNILRIIMELDAEPPQVVIQALIAEVDLNNSEEFGVELGLQTPVLFQRGIFPATAFQAGSTTNPGTAVLPTGASVTSANPVGQPGFLFNTTGPLGNNVAVNPGIVGFQGLGNLGVGRVSPTAGVGGFVFSAASDTFNLLIRALKVQGRVDILTRPQVTTTDNQQAQIVVGQQVPFIEGANINTLGNVTPIINYKNIGIILTVTPRISPDGKVIMRVHPEVSSLAQSQINLGNGLLASVFNDQFVDTTVIAGDGETVAIGGMIQKRDQKTENKIPWVGDLPYVGTLFRYRTQAKTKTELLVILTPHIVRGKMDADLILGQEARRMDWVLGDVMKMHATTGMEPVLPAPPGGGPGVCPPGVGPAMAPVLAPPAAGQEIHAPRPVNPMPPAGQAPSAATTPAQGMAPTQTYPGVGLQAAPAQGGTNPAPSSYLPPPNNGPNAPNNNGTEKGKWNFLDRFSRSEKTDPGH